MNIEFKKDELITIVDVLFRQKNLTNEKKVEKIIEKIKKFVYNNRIM